MQLLYLLPLFGYALSLLVSHLALDVLCIGSGSCISADIQTLHFMRMILLRTYKTRLSTIMDRPDKIQETCLAKDPLQWESA